MFQALPVDSVFFHSLSIFCTHTLPCRPPVCPGWLTPSARASTRIGKGSLSLWLQLLRVHVSRPSVQEPGSPGHYLLLHGPVQM